MGEFPPTCGAFSLFFLLYLNYEKWPKGAVLGFWHFALGMKSQERYDLGWDYCFLNRRCITREKLYEWNIAKSMLKCLMINGSRNNYLSQKPSGFDFLGLFVQPDKMTWRSDLFHWKLGKDKAEKYIMVKGIKVTKLKSKYTIYIL